MTDAHLIENGVIIQTESDDPRFGWTIANPIKISGESCRPVADPPAYGQDTRQLLAEHGFSAEDVERLLQEQVVFAAE